MFKLLVELFKIASTKAIILGGVLIVFSGVFELVGVGFIATTIKLLSERKSDLIEVCIPNYCTGIFFSSNQIIFLTLFMIVASYGVRWFTLLALQWYGIKFTFEISKKCILTLFDWLPSEINKYGGVAKVSNLITVKIPLITRSIIVPCFYIVNSSIYGAFILFICLALNAKFTLLLLSFIILIYLALLIIFKSKLSLNSKNISSFSDRYMSEINSFIRSFDELKLKISIKEDVDRIAQALASLNKAVLTNQVIGFTPRYLIELFILVGIFVYFTFFIGFSLNLQELTSIALILFLLQKLLPQVQLAYSSLIDIRGNIEVAHDLLYVLEKEVYPKNSEYRESFDEIKIKGAVGGMDKSKPLIEINNILLQKGNVYLIKGESGAGKSSFLGFLMGHLPYQSGSYFIDGKLIDLAQKNFLAGSTTYIPQNFFFREQKLNEIFSNQNSLSILSKPLS